MRAVAVALGGPVSNRWKTSALLAAIGAVVLLPYVVAGPGHFVDDWFALRNAVTDGWWHAAGDGQWRARPGAGLVYALTFGLIGARPWVHVALAAVVLVVSALVLARLLRRFLPPLVATAVAGTWLVVPNHTSLEAWPSAMNIALALLLLLLAVDRLTRDQLTFGRQIASSLLLALAVLTYEATAPVGVVAVLLLAWRCRGDRQDAARLLVVHGVFLTPVAAWMLLNWNDAKTDIDEWIDPVQVVNGHISTGVVGEHAGAMLLGAAVLVISSIAAYLRLFRSDETTSWPTTSILAGWAVIVLGSLPFLRYFYAPVGLGDRVTVVSGIGGAAVLVGVVGWVGMRAQTAAAVVLAAAVLVGAVGHRISLTHDYAAAADDSRRILAAVERRWPDPPDVLVVFGPYPVKKRNIVAFIDADWPLEWLYRTREVSAGFTLTEEAFRRVPAERRVNIVSLSQLQPVDRIDPGS